MHILSVIRPPALSRSSLTLGCLLHSLRQRDYASKGPSAISRWTKPPRPLLIGLATLFAAAVVLYSCIWMYCVRWRPNAYLVPRDHPGEWFVLVSLPELVLFLKTLLIS